MSPNTGAWNTLPGEQFEPRGRNPLGAYGYSTAASLRDGNPNEKTGEGFFWARIPAGKQFVVTTVRNPTKLPSQLKVFVSRDGAASSTEMIPAGNTVVVRTPLQAPDGTVCIRYAGEKTLVLLETDFQ